MSVGHGTVGAFVDVAALGEELALLLHLLRLLEHFEGVDVACDGDSLVELVAHDGADAVQVLQLLLHLLPALLAAHGHSELHHGERTVVAQVLLGVVGAVYGIFMAAGKHLQSVQQ